MRLRNQYPRRMRLGLIEARMIALVDREVDDRYPRRVRLGLIEAAGTG